MIVVPSFDFLHAAVSELHSDGADKGRLFATTVLAGQFFPSALAFFPLQGVSKYQALVYFPIAFVLAFVYARFRRNQIQSVRGALPSPVPARTRLLVTLFLFVGIVASAVAGRYSPLAAISVLLAVACLPWQGWAALQRAP